jgi:NPCBM/NEW2 domain
MADSDVAAMVPTTLREAQPGRYLDELAPLATTVGYGSFGLGGDLGYEGKSVIVQGQRRHHALSSHAPARLLFCLGGGYSTIRCAVGFNDDVPPNRSHCDFLIVVDGRQACSPVHVVAGRAPKTLVADVSGGQLVELIVTTSRWNIVIRSG